MYFYLCCDVSWYSHFRCFCVGVLKIFNVQRLLCRGLSLRVRQFLHFLLLYMIQPQQTALVNRISCCYLDDDSFFKHTDAKLFCNHLATFYIFFIIHHSSHSCAKKQVLQTKASQQLSGGTQSEAATSCSTQISSPNRPTSCSCLSDCYATKGTFSTLKLFEMLFVCALSIWT